MRNNQRPLLWPGVAAIITLVLIINLMGCSQTKEGPATESKAGKAQVKKMPETRTEIKLGLSSKRNMSYIPFFVAIKQGYYQKYNLNVQPTFVQGGVLALRGLQTGDFQIISSLPESLINGVAEGANVKIIGTLDDQSMYSIFLAKNITDIKELKGKIAAGNVTGNGTSIQLEYWLKKHGLEPNQDIRLINAGDNAQRLQAVQQGQAAITILSSPTDLKAMDLGLKRFLMRDTLKTYNHNMIAANGDLINNKPEAVFAFMAAHGEAVAFIKDQANREEVIQIAREALGMEKTEAERALDFVMPALADQGKMNIAGVEWAINTVKETKVLKKDISLEQLVDERFYAN